MVSLAAVAMGVLNTKDRFGVPASASTMFNVGSIVGGLACAYLLAPDYITGITAASSLSGNGPRTTTRRRPRAIIGMAIGTLIGGMLQWLIQVPSLRAVGYRWRRSSASGIAGVRQVMRLMAPAIIGVGGAAGECRRQHHLRHEASAKARLSWLELRVPVDLFADRNLWRGHLDRHAAGHLARGGDGEP